MSTSQIRAIFFYSYIMCTCLYLLAGTQEGKVSKFYIVPYRSVKKKPDSKHLVYVSQWCCRVVQKPFYEKDWI